MNILFEIEIISRESKYFYHCKHKNMFNNPLKPASIWRISEFEFQYSTTANVIR